MNDAASIITFRKRQDAVFGGIGLACTLVGVLTLALLFYKLAASGGHRLVPHVNFAEKPPITAPFLTNNDSRRPLKAGLFTAFVGSLGVIVITFAAAVPLGIATAVYLEEYAKKHWLTDLIEINIANLAGVPSITYGLMALWVFQSLFHWKLFEGIFGQWKTSSILVGGLTLALLVLPVVIVTTREALRAIPSAIREAAYACGATKWQLIRYHLLPYSLGGIATGTIIAMSRAVGETAPLIVVGAASYVNKLPPSPITSRFPFFSFRWLAADYTVMPLQMYNWMRDSVVAFQENAAAAGLVLIAFTLSMNAIAIFVRYRVRRNLKW